MKIKVIDLLNMIAKGEEVPRRIKYLGYEYCLFDSNSYSYIRNDKTRFFSTIMFKELNNEVIVIEDKPKEIEKIGMHFSFGYIDTDNRKLVFSELDKNLNLFGNKIDEIIDKVNEMSKDD